MVYNWDCNVSDNGRMNNQFFFKHHVFQSFLGGQTTMAKKEQAEVITVCAKIESELTDLNEEVAINNKIEGAIQWKKWTLGANGYPVFE